MKDKTAKEMFEELGFKFIKSEQIIFYVDGGEGNEFNCHPSDLSAWNLRIEFDLRDKTIDGADYICVSTLKAINKQCKELGWLDE